MSKLSFIDKLAILVEVSKSSIWFIIILIVLILLGVLFATTNKKNAKRNKKIYLTIIAFIIGLILVLYYNSLADMFDYLMNNLFIVIYFPNLAIYFSAIIITNIIFWVSIFNYKTSEIIKRVNIIVYILLNYLLALILGIINTEGLDVFSEQSVYKNKSAQALIELSSIIFIVWLIYLITYKIILKYIKKDNKQKFKKVIIKERVKELPDNYIPVSSPDYIYGTIPTKTTNNKIDSREINNNKAEIYELDKQLSEIAEKKKQIAFEKEVVKEFDEMLTLEDYKLLLKILIGQKKGNRNPIKKSDNEIIKSQQKEIERLEEEKRQSLKREQERIKKMKLQEEKRHQENLTELEMLYQSIR